MSRLYQFLMKLLSKLRLCLCQYFPMQEPLTILPKCSILKNKNTCKHINKASKGEHHETKNSTFIAGTSYCYRIRRLSAANSRLCKKIRHRFRKRPFQTKFETVNFSMRKAVMNTTYKKTVRSKSVLTTEPKHL